MTSGPQIDYEALAQGAMRAVVRTVLTRVAKTGLPGEHHFYIAFNTKAPGVVLSPRLRERYPEEMTVVLQHRFWDLVVTEERFEVNLTFDSIPERLVVPFAAIKVFFDPSVPYGLQFEDANLMGNAAQKTPKSSDEAMETSEKTTRARKAPALIRSERKPRAKKPSEAPGDAPPSDPVPLRPASAVKVPEPEAANSEDKDPPPGPKVVKLDAFRKK